MRESLVISVVKFFGKQLQGSANGKKHYARAWELLSDAKHGTLILLDFAGVNVATGSWMNAMIVPLYRRAADPEIDLFPILCNLPGDCIDDLALIAKWSHQCYVTAGNCRRPVRKARLIGALDQAQDETMRAVMEHGAVTGAELERMNPKAGIGATAWNNRLKDLYEKRLIGREKRGREQVYSPVLEAIEIHG